MRHMVGKRGPGIPGFLVLLIVLTAGALFAAPNDDLFENKVRPLLANNCAGCHGKAAMGGLNVESREALLKGGASGPAVIPGDPAKSLLIQAVRQEGDLKMPKGGKLRPSEVADLTEWIKLGAPWPEAKATAPVSAGTGIPAERRNFWSFQPLKNPTAPAVKDAKWPRSDIDKFILAKLDEEGLKPAAPADRRTLIRRLYFDLIGTPPTTEEVDAFVKSTSPDTYAKLVDRLLKTTQYGERWGRHWLDVVRFGEDDMRGLADLGYEPYGNAYIYRDWVIKAFNDDMPFDLFVKAQLAGDQLDETMRAKTLPGLGFLGQGPWYYDTNEPPIARADERHERVDTITRAMLGLTVGCARCHDHKYDPITQRDYYALAGIVGSTRYHEYPLIPEKTYEQWSESDKQIEAYQDMLKQFSKVASEELSEVLAEKTEPYMLAAWNVAGEPKKSLEDAAAEDKLDQELLGRWVNFLARPPAFYPYLKPWQAMIKSGGTPEEAQKLAKEFQELVISVLMEKRKADEKNEKIIAKGMPLDPQPSVILPNKFKSFFDRPQLDLVTLSLDRLNLWTDVFSRDLSEQEDTSGKFKPGLLVFRGYSLERQLSPEWAAHMTALKDQITQMKKALPPIPVVQGVIDVEQPHDFKIQLRGSPYTLGDDAPRRFLEVLSNGAPKPYTKGSGRLELAESIVSAPITARVIVNRVWKWHFGTGIVDTASNFGQAGDRPSHPELLDYLASSFIQNGWSIKKLQREILLTATYMEADTYDEAAFSKDPRNRLHWRNGRRRMEAEQIRDSILKISGSLDETPGGPSFDIADEHNTRRTVYGRVSRFQLDTFLQTFDFPNPVISNEGRIATNVPLQRLFFMNSDFVNTQATALAKRIAIEPGDENKIRKAYLLIYQREVMPEELKLALDFLKQQRAEGQNPKPAETPADAANRATAKVPSSVSAAAVPRKPETATPTDPWVSYVRTLFSSNEFLYID
jgi:cytochrome c553